MSDVKHGRRIRVVLDTNVYFSAFTKRGIPFGIWRAAIDRTFILIISRAIVQEIARVLRSDAAWEESRIVRRLKLLATVGEIVQPRVAIQVVTADPDDDRIIECAVAGHADLIVSGDHRLTKIKVFQGIGIIRPAYFLKTFCDEVDHGMSKVEQTRLR